MASRPLQAAERIAALDRDGMNASLACDPIVIQTQADAVAQRGDTPLGGLPVAVKDNICTLEYPTTCASRILDGFHSPYEATAVTRLKAAGGVVACKTNLDEFGMGSSTEYSAFGRTRHPLDGNRVPGGSSGGSAALVAAGAVDAALGSETGGSVRQPAAYCGVVGIKPTYGRVSRYGLVAFGSSLDQIGVLARSVEAAMRVLCVIAGPDRRDATAADLPPPSLAPARHELRDVAIGLPVEYFQPNLDPAIRAGCDRATAALRDAGAAVRNVTLPHTHLAVPTYYIVAPAEASSNLSRYDGVRYGRRAALETDDVHALYRATRGAGFGPEVRRRIVVGTYVLSAGYYNAYYKKALVARRRIALDFAAGFAAGVDFLLTPTAATTAFRAGEKVDDPVAMYRTDAFVCPANLAGLPALSLPVGRADGLPIGAQLIGPAFSEAEMASVAGVIERQVDAAGEVR